MASYPSLTNNMGVSSPSTRNDIYNGENVYMLDREQTSFVALFNLGKEYVQAKDNYDDFRDFYAGSIGTTLLELSAGYSEFNAYHAIVARREDYLYEAQLRDSGIALSANLGYSVYRGNNPKLTLTITPTMDVIVKKFDIIGSANGYDVVALEDKTLELGVKTDISVVLGTLKIATHTISDARTYDFRFNQDLISEDILLRLDGEEVPISKILYDLLSDKFIIISNPVGGIDVKYLNRFQPKRWESFGKYTFFEYILPTYDWRPFQDYSVGDICCKIAPIDAMPILYECIAAGTSLRTEPVWNEETDAITTDGPALRWKCIGRMEKQLYFKCISPGQNISGEKEPIWPIVTGTTVSDGGCSWICVDTFEQSKFFYNTGSELELTYVELEDVKFSDTDVSLDIAVVESLVVQSNYQQAETLAEMKRNAPLYNETRYVIRGREDYRKIFRILTPNAVDANGFDPIPAVVDLSYVKNHTNKVWTPDKMINVGDEVLATKVNNLIYRATTSGYCGLTRKGMSGETEPVWVQSEIPARKECEDVVGLPLVRDNQIVWEAYYINESAVRPDRWKSNNTYTLGDRVWTDSGLIFKAIKFYTEPEWPTSIGQTVQDNEVTWMCVDDIFFDGFDADYWIQEHKYEVGDFVQPVVENGYFYKCVKAGTSCSKEPYWVTTICGEVPDGSVVWQCYDRTDSAKYVKNNVLNQLAKYRQYGVSPAVMDDPVLVMVYMSFDIVTNTYIDSVTINNDIFNILDKYQQVLETHVDVQTLEHDIERLSYVRVCRAAITGNSKVIEWKPGTLYRIKDVVYPPKPNGFLYVANRIQTGGYGYTQWEDRSYSGEDEPSWGAADEPNLYDVFNDKHLVWQLRPTSELGGVLPYYWEPDTVYQLGACVLPTNRTDTKWYAKVIEIQDTNFEWPTVPGTSVLDGRIYWTCIDPNKTAAPLGWNEYYMFSWETNITQYKKL